MATTGVEETRAAAAAADLPPLDTDSSSMRQRHPQRQHRSAHSFSHQPSPSSSSSSSPSSRSAPRRQSAPPSPSLSTALKQCTAQLAYELLPYDALPAWFKDNPYISSGYRVDIGWRNSCSSLCHLHNETVNIWSHFIAFLLVLVLLIVTLIAMSPHGVDRLNLGVIQMTRVRDAVAYEQQEAPVCPLDLRSSPGAAVYSAPPAAAMDSGIGNCSLDEPHVAAHLSFLSNLEQFFSSPFSPSSYLPTPVTEVYDRLQHHLPDLQHLMRSLRAQADSVASVLQSSSSSLSSSLRPLALSSFSSTHAKFLSFLSRVEEHLSSLHSTVSSSVSLETALRLKQLMLDNVGGFGQHLTFKKQLDMARVVQAMMREFVRTMMEEEQVDAGQHLGAEAEDGKQDDSGSTAGAAADVENDSLGLAVRVRRWAGLGDGDLFFGLQDDPLLHPTPAAVAQQERARRREWEADVQLHFFLPRWPLAVFMVSALICLLFSAMFHCFQAVSKPTAMVFQALDYCGITLLIAGSNIPVIYYGFYCLPSLSLLYNSVIAVLALVCFLFTILPSMQALRFRTLKTCLFLLLGFAGVVPLVHLVLHLGYIHFIVYYLAAMGMFYVGGAVFYLFHIPERWWPGRFDVCLSSHQIWHMLIVAAVLTHYLGLIHFYEWRMSRVCAV